MHVTAIIVAAGAGRRIGGATAKTYLPISGPAADPANAGSNFCNAGNCRCRAGRERRLMSNDCRTLLSSDASLKGRACVLQAGGATRQQSVRRGLEKLGRGDRYRDDPRWRAALCLFGADRPLYRSGGCERRGGGWAAGARHHQTSQRRWLCSKHAGKNRSVGDPDAADFSAGSDRRGP